LEGLNLRTRWTADERSLRWDYDLSRNKSLRTLETTAASIAAAGDQVSIFLKTVVSTITSPLLLDVVIIYTTHDLSDSSLDLSPALAAMVEREAAGYAASHEVRFRVFREMHQVRDLQLVLCADGGGSMWGYARKWNYVTEVERGKGVMEYILCEPLIVYERWLTFPWGGGPPSLSAHHDAP